jgi:hypothetical protein
VQSSTTAESEQGNWQKRERKARAGNIKEVCRECKKYFRNPYDKYTAVNNDFVQDKSLSWEARGLLLYILSKPDDWDIYLEELVKNSPNTKSATERAFKELVKAGYIYQTCRSLGYRKWKWFKFASDKKINPQIKDSFEKQADGEMLSTEKIV